MRRGLHSTLCLVLLFVDFGFGHLSAQEATALPSTKLDQEVEAIISSLRANRERFPFASVKQVKTKGLARSMEDAFAREWLSDPKPVRSERQWIIDGDTVHFEEMFPSELTDQPQSQFSNRIEAFDRTLVISRFPKTRQTHVARIGKMEPLRPAPLAAVESWINWLEHGTLEFQRDLEVDGRSALGVTSIQTRQDGQTVTRFLLDPSRGFLPLRIEINEGPEGAIRNVRVFEEYIESRGGWLPLRWITASSNTTMNQPCSVEEFITEWNVDERPSPELLRVAITPGESFFFESGIRRPTLQKPVYRVRGSEIDLAWFKEDGSVDVPDGAVELLDLNPVPTIQLTDADVRPRPTPWQMIMVVAISSSIGFGGLLLLDWFRRRRRIAQTSGAAPVK